MGSLQLKSLTKAFGQVQVLHGIDLDVRDGEFVAFVGPSGCGKSTLLRIIAGLEDATSGNVQIDGIEVTHAAPAKRGIAMVFQTYALYPHLSVKENMALGLRQAKTPAPEIETRIARASDMLSLQNYMTRRPAELSGGQRQRVAIGRAIVRQPKLFLFDEPLSNLDAALRVNTRLEIARLHRELSATMIYVTHDQVEAMTLADRIVVMNSGQVEQSGSPMELYNRPANLFVAGFIGSPQMNLVPAVEFDRLDCTTMGIRPEHLRLGINGTWPCTVQHVEHLGADTNVYVATANGTALTARVFGEVDFPLGAKVWASADPRQLHRFDIDGKAIYDSSAP